MQKEIIDFIEPIPFIPIRKSFLGERVFGFVYKTYFNQNKVKFIEQMETLKIEPTQNNISLITSFFIWLGTNCGQVFIEQAKSKKTTLQKSFKSELTLKKDAIILAFIDENQLLSNLDKYKKTISKFLKYFETHDGKSLLKKSQYELECLLNRNDYYSFFYNTEKLCDSFELNKNLPSTKEDKNIKRI